ncbi:MAG TPA: hypothetical protein VGN86_12455 [Pyrinomonadaceae bacterium]|jgi:hypothetical protein|nr:hypothetical protein [Pyrinomonadaceae bacterium]
MFLDSSDSSPLTEDEINDISRFLKNGAKERRKLRVRDLSIFADGKELPVNFDVLAAESITLDIDEGVRKLEVKARQEPSEIPLAIQWLDWNHRGRSTIESAVSLEGGKRFDFRFNYEDDGDGNISHARMNISYSERTKLRAVQLGLQRIKNRLVEGRPQFWSWTPVAVKALLLVACLIIGVQLLLLGRRPSISTIQPTSQLTVVVSGGVSGVVVSTSLEALKNKNTNAGPTPGPRRDSIARKTVPQNRSGAFTARRVKPISGSSDKAALDNNSETAVKGTVPDNPAYSSDQTRSADVRPLPLSSRDVRPGPRRDSIARKTVPQNRSGAFTARRVKPISGGSDKPVLDNNSETAVKGTVPDNPAYSSDQTRSADVRRLANSLRDVRSVYIDSGSFGEPPFAKTVSDLFSGANGLIKISKFAMSPHQKNADAVLRGGAAKSGTGWEVSARLVNLAGRAIWQAKVIVSGMEEQQAAEEAVRKLMEKLQADLNSER